MNKTLLLRLARKLDKANRKQFNMGNWSMKTLDKNGNVCGTTCCAMGLACTLPSFKKAGLALEWPPAEHSLQMAQLVLRDLKGRSIATGFYAAATVCGISRSDAYYLFKPWEYGEKASPKKVAARIRAFVKNGGQTRAN